MVGSRARYRRTCPWSCCDIARSQAPKENLRAPHGMMRVIREVLSAACRRYHGSRDTIRMRAMVIAQRAARWARSELPSAWLFAAQGEFLLSHNARKYLNLGSFWSVDGPVFAQLPVQLLVGELIAAARTAPPLHRSADVIQGVFAPLCLLDSDAQWLEGRGCSLSTRSPLLIIGWGPV